MQQIHSAMRGGEPSLSTPWREPTDHAEAGKETSWQLSMPVLNGALCTCSVYEKFSNPTFTSWAIFWVYGALHKKCIHLEKACDSFTIQAVKKRGGGMQRWLKIPNIPKSSSSRGLAMSKKDQLPGTRGMFYSVTDRRLQVCIRQVPWRTAGA